MRWVAGLVVLASCTGDGPGLTVITGEGLFTPGELDFDERIVGATHELTTVLTNPRVGDLRVSDVRFDPPVNVYAARVEGGGTLRGALIGSGRRVTVRVLFAPRQAGRFDTTMRVVFDDLAADLQLKAVARTQLDADLSFSPSRLAFTPLEIGRVVTQDVQVTNVGDLRGTLREVRLSSSLRRALPGRTPYWVSLEGSSDPVEDLFLEPGTPVMMQVHFQPIQVGEFADDLQWVLASGRAAGLEVAGRGARAGTLRCAPASLDFGLVRRGDTATMRTTCTATAGMFTFQDVRVTGFGAARFSLVSAPAPLTALAAGASTEIVAEFSADALSSRYAATLQMTAAHGDTSTVSMQGEIEPPPPEDIALTAQLSWFPAMADLDLHLVRNGESPFEDLHDCYFRNKNPDWGQLDVEIDDPFLDRDDLDSGGPEEVNLTVPGEGRYDVYVHYFGTTRDDSIAGSVDIQFRGQSVHQETVNLPSCGRLWHVATVRFDVAPPLVTPVNAITDASNRARCP